MQVKSIFLNNEKIPVNFTCDRENISPPLEITDIPQNTRSLAIINDDPDAPNGDWVHWVVWNIPVPSSDIPIEKGVSPGIEGTTSFGSTGYSGPCPPSGTHRYFFKVYALDKNLELKEGATKQDLLKAMENHIIEKAQIIGLYKRNCSVRY